MEVAISAVIITFNEERNIRRCLDSLTGIADEVIVIDSYSTDNTGNICSEYSVRFIQHRFIGHIEQKNWALLQAKYPYILSLDADEVLSPELRHSILEIKKNWTHDGYYFNRLTSYCGKWIRHTSWYPSRKLRLWDSRKGRWGGFNPHDRFYLDRGATKKFLKGDILHYSYYTVDEHMEQINRFSSILAHSYFQRGTRVYILSLILHPLWRFLKDYILKAGFLDGYYGFIVSVNSAHEVFLKYVKLRNIYLEQSIRKKDTICFFNSMKSWGGGEKWHYDVATFLKRNQVPTLLISTRNSPLALKLHNLGVRSYSMNISNLSFLNPVKIYRISRIYKSENVKTVVSNLSGDMKIASLSAMLAGVPNIIYRRGSAIPIRNTPINRFLFRKVITHVVANSIETKRTIFANNPNLIPEDKITVIYNGILTRNYQLNSPLFYNRQDGEIILGSAGRLSEEKGQVHLLELARNLKKMDLKFKLLLAGEGRLLNYLKRTARQLGVLEEVVFCGFVEDMPSFFHSIDIFLLTSLYEGFGYVIAEAMACGKPVVAFDINSSAEIVVHEKTGFLTRKRDLNEMVERIIQLSRDEELRKKMGESGKKRVEELFSFEKSKAEIEKLLTPELVI